MVEDVFSVLLKTLQSRIHADAHGLHDARPYAANTTRASTTTATIEITIFLFILFFLLY
jgi:hypothetical protein